MIKFILKHKNRTLVSAIASYFVATTLAALPVATCNQTTDVVRIAFFLFAASQTLMWLEDSK